MVALKSSDLAWPCRSVLSGELFPSRRLPIGRRDCAGIFDGDESFGKALLLREWPGLVGGPAARPDGGPMTEEPKVDADKGLRCRLPPAVGVLLRVGGGPRIVLALFCDGGALLALLGPSRLGGRPLGVLLLDDMGPSRLGGRPLGVLLLEDIAPSRLGGKALGVLLLGGRAIAALASSSSKYLRP